MKAKEFENTRYVRSDFSDEVLGKIWRNYDFEKAEKKLYNMQCKLTKAVFAKNEREIRWADDIFITARTREDAEIFN